MDERFTFFWTGPFSQWHPSLFTVDGVEYTHAEQYMMAQKAIMFEGPELYVKDAEGKTIMEREYCGAPETPKLTTLGKIMQASHPREQKRLGREVKNFDESRWNAVVRNFVYKGNMAKFLQNPELRYHLLMTDGTTLVEASPRDRIWGIGVGEHDIRRMSRMTWLGTNWLGEVLTKVRNDIVNEVHELSEGFQWSDFKPGLPDVDEKALGELPFNSRFTSKYREPSGGGT